ncbi:MAG: plastocyanin/azurin family copper-binding protein [Rhodanobacteraceae bacterium]
MASAGAQSANKGTQEFAFLPNEIWIHAGDNIAWTNDTDVTHTVSFLMPNQVRPSSSTGCPGTTPNPSGFDGTQCVNSGPMTNGQSYTVVFPTPGNYKLVDLGHASQNGVVHVLDTSLPLPHDQAYYDRFAARTRRDLFLQGQVDSVVGYLDSLRTGGHEVTAGVGGITATAGGQQNVSVMRFMQPRVDIRAGDTVEWSNVDPSTPHTITFGIEPLNLKTPSGNVSTDADGGLHATISSTDDNVNSGYIVASANDRTGVEQSALGVTHFRVTFTQPGIYPYICALHDELGMTGMVVVH